MNFNTSTANAQSQAMLQIHAPLPVFKPSFKLDHNTPRQDYIHYVTLPPIWSRSAPPATMLGQPLNSESASLPKLIEVRFGPNDLSYGFYKELKWGLEWLKYDG